MTEQVYIVSRDGKRIGITRESEAMGGLAWFHANVHAYSSAHAIAHEGYSVEAAEPDCSDVAALIEGIAERLGIAADFEFVPFSRSRNVAMESFTGEPWQSLNWRVTVKQRGRTILATNYGQGVGYCPADKRKWNYPAAKARAIALEIETGKVARAGVLSQGEPIATAAAIAPPRLGDVLQSLALDSRVLDEGTFEQWAESLGYSSDSRKAEAIWKACVEIATQLRGALGNAALAELQLAAEFN